MPLPLAPLLPIALRIGAVAGTGWAVCRWLRARSFPGRTDQHAETAFDALGEGVSLHRPQDRAADGATQTNATARLVRRVKVGGTSIELDAALMARFRLRRGA